MTIALQDGRESNQKDPSSQDNSVTPPLNKGKAKSEPKVQKFNDWMRTSLGTENMQETPLRNTLRKFLGENWG